jgi:hypothetical protein
LCGGGEIREGKKKKRSDTKGRGLVALGVDAEIFMCIPPLLCIVAELLFIFFISMYRAELTAFTLNGLESFDTI